MKYINTNDKKTPALFKFIRWACWLVTPRFTDVGKENIPDEPCVIVGNHSQTHGAIAGEIYIPGKHRVWCAGEMMDRKEAAKYTFSDFWSKKPWYIRWIYKLWSMILPPISELIFKSAMTVPVYHDTRLITTFRESMKELDAGYSMVIYPECYDEHNNIVHEFQDKFVDLARFYYKKSGKELAFVPLYIAPKLSKMYYGKPIRFNHDAPIEEERKRITGYLMDSITEIAVSLPEHTVVPYPNIPKKQYPKNIPLEVYNGKD